ncbi:DUF4383 domain-containing protein [Streptomyces sp. NPDC006627]
MALRPAHRPPQQRQLVPLNNADDWLHFVLGVGMIALGTLPTRRTNAAR